MKRKGGRRRTKADFHDFETKWGHMCPACSERVQSRSAFFRHLKCGETTECLRKPALLAELSELTQKLYPQPHTDVMGSPDVGFPDHEDHAVDDCSEGSHVLNDDNLFVEADDGVENTEHHDTAADHLHHAPDMYSEDYDPYEDRDSNGESQYHSYCYALNMYL